jgi:predicted DNA binding CopG/RHH family protein
MTNKKYELDAYEQDIEDNFVGNGVSIMTDDFIQKAQEAAKRHSANRKSITIRVLERDLNKIKFKAAKKALPYQTYINMLLHKDAMSA